MSLPARAAAVVGALKTKQELSELDPHHEEDENDSEFEDAGDQDGDNAGDAGGKSETTVSLSS
jgi:hypothetical protein